MTKKLLIGASVLALSVLGATGAWANPQNVFSSGTTTTVASSAVAAGGNATSESFNSQENAVSNQTLTANAVGVDLAGVSIPVLSGNATISSVTNNSGITNTAANSGTASVSQQATSLAAIGTVNIAH